MPSWSAIRVSAQGGQRVGSGKGLDCARQSGKEEMSSGGEDAGGERV